MVKLFHASWLVLLCLANHVTAQTHKAHMHGEADMSIVFDKNVLLMELETPAANVLGFEYAPRSEKEKAKLKAMVNTLNQVEGLFTISPACKLTEKSINVPFIFSKEDPHEDHATHEEEHNHHREENKTEHADEEKHGHEHSGEHEDERGHQDIHLTFQWRCPKTEMLSISVNLFRVFDGFEKVRVQWIAFDTQKALSLNKNETTVIISP